MYMPDATRGRLPTGTCVLIGVGPGGGDPPGSVGGGGRGMDPADGGLLKPLV